MYLTGKQTTLLGQIMQTLAEPHEETEIREIMGDLVAQAQAKAALPPPKRQTKKITPAGLILTGADQKLIEASAEIAITPPAGEDMAFTHAVLCQVGLPRAKVEGREGDDEAEKGQPEPAGGTEDGGCQKGK